MHTKTQAGRRGQTLVLLAVAMVPLLGMAGLGVDVGRMYTTRRRAQEVADIVAAAGAHEQMRKGTKAPFDTIVRDYASRNGFSESAGDIIVTSNPPTSGPYQGNGAAYEVTIKRPVSTALLRVLGSSATTVQGRAVAVIKKTGIGIVVLEPNKSEAFKINKKSKIQVNDGTVYVNSKDSHALKIDQDSKLTTHGPVQIVGGYETKNNSSIVPPPNDDASPIDDPLASLPVPPCSLPVRNGTKDAPQTLEPSNNAVLCPGIYFGGMKVMNVKNLTLSNCGVPPSEAVFVLSEKGIHVHKSDITADGVTLYIAPKDFCKTTRTDCEGVRFHDGADITITPPSSGSYEGIAIFQDRSCKKTVDIKGSALSGIKGDIYAKAADMKVKGKKKAGASGVINASIVVNRLSIGNWIGTDDLETVNDDGGETEEEADGDLEADFTSTTGGSAKRVVLYE